MRCYQKPFSIYFAVFLFVFTPLPHYGQNTPPSSSGTDRGNAQTTSSQPRSDMYGAARDAGSSQGQAALISMLAAGIAAKNSVNHASRCTSKTPHECVLASLWGAGAALSMLTAGNMNSAAQQSAVSAGQLSSGSGQFSWNTQNSGAATERSIQSIAQSPKGREIQKRLDEVCRTSRICVDAATGVVRTPYGTTNIRTATPEGFASATGMSVSDAGRLRDLMNQAFEQAESALQNQSGAFDRSQFGLEEYGAGTATSLGATESPPIGEDWVTVGKGARGTASVGAEGTASKTALLAGLSKNFNGDPIGIAEENIFTLVNRRYQLHAKTQTLLVPSVTEPVRNP